MADCDQAYESFMSRKYQHGLQILSQTFLKAQNLTAQHNNKALYLFHMGDQQSAIKELNQALDRDMLNYPAYFNLFSIMLSQSKFTEAFKNLCCCLSIGYLLRGKRNKSEMDIQKSIEYSFNNKEARLLKGVMKMQNKKYIQAMNQFNYAMYLDPGCKKIQKVLGKVYKQLNMAELTIDSKTKKKAKFDRLETSKSVPEDYQILEELNKLLKEFNQVIKGSGKENIYRIKGDKNLLQKSKLIKQEEVICLKSQINFIEEEERKQNQQKKTDHYVMNSIHLMNASFNLDNSLQALNCSKEDDFSLSTLSQNSKIKLTNHINLSDISQVLNSSKEGQGDMSNSRQSKNFFEVKKQSKQESKMIEIKFPKKYFENLKANEKFIVEIKKISMNQDRKMNNCDYQVDEKFEIYKQKSGKIYANHEQNILNEQILNCENVPLNNQKLRQINQSFQQNAKQSNISYRP